MNMKTVGTFVGKLTNGVSKNATNAFWQAAAVTIIGNGIVMAVNAISDAKAGAKEAQNQEVK
jgi:hypothetical protein